MAQKALFTTQEFLQMIENSPTVRKMKASQIYALFLVAMMPFSPQALRIYRILKEEQILQQRIGKNFSKTMQGIMGEFEEGLRQLESDAKRRRLQRKEKQNLESEQVTTQDLLQQLHTQNNQ